MGPRPPGRPNSFHRASHQDKDVWQHGTFANSPHQIQPVELLPEASIGNDERSRPILEAIPECIGTGKGGNVPVVQHELVFDMRPTLAVSYRQVDPCD
jgi:hypothetical protein